MKNTGSTAWRRSEGYRLGSQSPRDNGTWGTGRVDMDVEEVAPGQQTTFTFTATAPAVPGNYTFHWCMLRENVQWFGEATPAIIVSVVEKNDAAFVSQSVPTEATAGKPFSTSVTMKNTGSTTWRRSEGYRLGSQSPRDNGTWGTGRVDMDVAEVAPGQQTTFTFTATAPAVPGNYTFHWRMLRELVEWFGEATPAITVSVVEKNDAAFVSQSVPTEATAGKPFSTSVTMKNTGFTPWRRADGYRLGSQSPRDNGTWGTGRVDMDVEKVAPGEETTFTFTATAPAVPGCYTFHWRMLRELVEWFGEPTPAIAVCVMGENDAAFVSDSWPPDVQGIAMQAGASFGVSVTMKNTGSTTWRRSKRYRLGYEAPQDNLTWGFSSVELTEDVAPGQETTLTFTATAPTVAGSYAFQGRMLCEDSEWFGAPTRAMTINAFAGG